MSAVIVIVEGADAAGKSTYIADQQANSTVPTRSIHNKVPPAGMTSKQLYHLYKNQLQLAILYRGYNISTYIDRSFLSELLYGPMYRGGSLLTRKQVHRLERYCRYHGITLLGMGASTSIRQARMLTRGEVFDDKARMMGVKYSRYFLAHPAWETSWQFADTPALHA